jgi:hypothetical protein
MYVKKNGGPPQEVGDLTENDPIHTAGVRALTSGDCVLICGVEPKQNPGAVLAYQKNAPEQGGLVLTADGNIRPMSAADLKAALAKK